MSPSWFSRRWESRETAFGGHRSNTREDHSTTVEFCRKCEFRRHFWDWCNFLHSKRMPKNDIGDPPKKIEAWVSFLKPQQAISVSLGNTAAAQEEKLEVANQSLQAGNPAEESQGAKVQKLRPQLWSKIHLWTTKFLWCRKFRLLNEGQSMFCKFDWRDRFNRLLLVRWNKSYSGLALSPKQNEIKSGKWLVLATWKT